MDNSLEKNQGKWTIPPAVISSAEQRRLKTQKKKTDNNKKEKDSELENFKKLLEKYENSGDEEGIKNVEEQLMKQNPDFKNLLEKLRRDT